MGERTLYIDCTESAIIQFKKNGLPGGYMFYSTESDFFKSFETNTVRKIRGVLNFFLTCQTEAHMHTSFCIKNPSHSFCDADSVLIYMKLIELTLFFNYQSI